MYATLVVVGGKADTRQFNIKLPAMLGRSRQADLTIAHSLISRKHCELRESEGAVLLVDLGSLNGTFCRDRKIQRAPLLPNDRFTVGPLTFEIRYEFDGDGKPTLQAADGPTIELADPIEPSPVELDEPLEAYGYHSGPIEAKRPLLAFGARNKDLAGFGQPVDPSERAPAQSRYEHHDGEAVEIDLAPDDPAHFALDAPTDQCSLPLVDSESELTDSPGSGTEDED